jgi:hypothetical protein
VDVHTFTKQTEKLKKKVICQKAGGYCFLGQERGADGDIHATRDHNNIRSVLRNAEKLHRDIQKKRRGMLIAGIVLLHDSARPHTSTAARIRALLEHFNWVLFDYFPYNADLSPNICRLFNYLSN